MTDQQKSDFICIDYRHCYSILRVVHSSRISRFTFFLASDFFLMGVHVKPSDVVQELEALGPAFLQASKVHGTERGVIMGDLNAGCRYYESHFRTIN